MAQENANTRLNDLFQRFGIWACSAMMAFGILVFQDHRAQLGKLEEKVNHLYIDKVSRAELKEEVNRILVAQEASKADILSRLEIYFGRISREK
ncbi:hypothetical protein D3C85_801310 [compost metagenome]